MLVGNIVYRHGDKVYKYNVEGVDTSSTLKLRLSTPFYNAILFMSNENASEDEDPTALDERRVDINVSSITVETGNHKDSTTGKLIKHPINKNFFCRLGALIRYCKSHCSVRNTKGYMGLSLASGDFEIQSKTDYVIPFEVGEGTLAEITLRFDSIYDLKIRTEHFDIDLHEDSALKMSWFPKINNGAQSGIAFNADFLDFQLKPVTKPKLEIDAASDFYNLYSSLDEVIEAHPDKEFSWLLEKDYIIVDDEHLQEICDYIMAHDGYVYYDTETTGLNINFKSRIGQADQLVGVVLSVKFGESFYFPCQMKKIPNLCGGDHWYFMEHYMRPILEGKELVAHNMTFDWKVAYIYDINANIVHDTLAILKLTLGAEQLDWRVGLKENTKLLLHRDSLELSDLVRDNSWGESDVKFWDLPYELVRLYACADTDNTNGLLQYAIQNDLLKRYNAVKIYEIEIAFSFAVAYQEFMGHHIDIQNIELMTKQVESDIARCMKEMEQIVGHEFNPNSSPQLQKIMYTELGIPPQISRKTGRLTTDKDTLAKLAELENIDGEKMYPFCAKMLEFREHEGVRKIIAQFPELMTQDGYIFSEVQQYGTTTGRVSIKKPNYQSYSNPVKKNVVPRPGYYMFDTDYSSVEYRVLGNMVGNKRIMESFKDPDFDYHAYQAAHMYGVPYSAVTKKLRKAAKGINFGLPYGMGDESLGIRVFGEASEENTRKAAQLRAAYFKGQEDIRDWFEYHRNRGVNEGFTETFFGRRRYYHRSKFSEGAIRRQAGNQVIQGTAADIYKTAVGRVFKRICREGWLGKVLIVGFIHDEMLCEISNDIDPMEWLKVAREEFEVKIHNDDGSPWCPLYMGCGFGMSWYEAKSVELPIKLQWEFVERYGDTGYPKWNFDGRAFCDEIPDILRDFEVRDIRNQILDEGSQNKEIKPTLNNQLIDCISYDAKNYNKAISDYITESGDYAVITAENTPMPEYLATHEKLIEAYLDEHYHIQKLYRDANGNFCDDIKGTKATQQCLDMFCILHDVDRSRVHLDDIAEYTATDTQSNVVVELDVDDKNYETAEDRQHRIDVRVDTFGMYVDTDLKIVTLLMVEPQYMNFIKQHANGVGNGYKIMFKDNVNKKMWDTKFFLASEEINIIQAMYLQYFKSKQ